MSLISRGNCQQPDRADVPVPRITIVTPSYNQAPFLEETIRSVLSQGYPNLEYIVIDGGSTDGSVAIVKKHEASLAHWISEPDRGQAHAINKGLALATGEIIAYLNSDDVYRPGALAAAARFFLAHPNTEILYAAADRIDAQGRVFERVEPPEFDPARLLRTCFIRQPAVFLRRSLVDRLGPFDESLSRCMDYEYWLRAAAVTAPRRAGFLAAGDRFHASAKSNGDLAGTLREEIRVVDRALRSRGADDRSRAARQALLPRFLITVGCDSGAEDDERAAALLRIGGLAPPSVDELVEVVGGHDAYFDSPFTGGADTSGDRSRVDVYGVLPALAAAGLIDPAVERTVAHRLKVLRSVRVGVRAGNLRVGRSALATAMHERWIWRSRTFWVQVARSSSTTRRYAQPLQRLLRVTPVRRLVVAGAARVVTTRRHPAGRG